MKLVLTEAALDDLRSVRAYTLETRGAEQEERYLRNLWARFETIRSNPHRFRLREDLFPGCRIAAEGRPSSSFEWTTTPCKSSASCTPPWTSNATSGRNRSEPAPRRSIFGRRGIRLAFIFPSPPYPKMVTLRG